MGRFHSFIARFKRHDVAQGKGREEKGRANLKKKVQVPVLKFNPMPDRFPWAAEKRVINRPNFSLTLYQDGSRLYLFKQGGHLILTPEGVSILKGDPKAIKRYVKGEKVHLVDGGNSRVNMFNAANYPTIVKEHHSGLSAVTQMEHARKIHYTLLANKSPNSAPEYYATGSFPGHPYLREVSVMELLQGRKVTDIQKELEANPTPENMRRLSRMLKDYKSFEKWLRKKNLPITDFHQGNIIATYAKDLGRYIFGVIDQ